MSEVLNLISIVGDDYFPNHGILSQLAASMKIRDELQEQERELLRARKDFEDPLLDLDPEAEADLHHIALGATALGYYLANKQLGKIRKDISEIVLLSRLVSTHGIVGSRATITSTNRELYTIGTSRRNRYGELDGLSQWHQERTGVITNLDLSPGYGGGVEIKGKFGLIYSAAPLIDRNNNYQPAFTVNPA